METTRIGGILLMLACGMMPFIIVEYLYLMSGLGPDAGIAGRLAHSRTAHHALSRGWHFEAVGMAMFAVAAFCLAQGSARAGWIVAGVGAIAVLPMYALMIGGFGTVKDLPNEQAGPLFMTIRAIATEIFYFGNLIMSAGMTLALAALVRSGGTAPGWVLWPALLGWAGSALGFLALYAGLPVPMAVAGLFALVGFVATAVLGASVAANGL